MYYTLERFKMDDLITLKPDLDVIQEWFLTEKIDRIIKAKRFYDLNQSKHYIESYFEAV